MFMVEFPNKSIRLKQFDYSQPGFYFVTICIKNRVELFGNITQGKMHLNPLGLIAEQIWEQTPKSYSCAALNEFIFMPNHMHGIVIIKPHGSHDGTPRHAATGLRSLVSDSLPSIINHYKGAVTKACKKLSADFAWQSRFYDHIIRKDESLDKIREYIRNNPLKWELDRNNPESLWM